MKEEFSTLGFLCLNHTSFKRQYLVKYLSSLYKGVNKFDEHQCFSLQKKTSKGSNIDLKDQASF